MGMIPFQAEHGDSPSVFYDSPEGAFGIQQTSFVSDFGEGITLDVSDTSGHSGCEAVALAKTKSAVRPDWKETGLRSFSSLISSRLGYLEGLQNLQQGWASGGAIGPSLSAIIRTKGLLALIGKKVLDEEVSLIPRIVMGPIPSGGIIVELHADDENAINVTIANDDHVEVEVLYGGHYFDVDIQGSEVIGMVTAQYASISR